jgi:predicted 2-oxoglutarate/Fe(II)-dependent dioxygenase YbiX
MFESDIIDLPKGSIMVFPSNFLYPHKVTEVTNGTRYSFVSWCW